MADIREQIEQYALGKLSGTALEAFEARLAADPAFADEVAREVELIRAIRLMPEVEALRSQLAMLEGEAQFEQKKTARVIPMRVLFAAAATILLGLAGIWFFELVSAPSSEELFVAHFRPPLEMAAPKTGRGAADTAQTEASAFFALLDAVEKDYQNGDMPGALEKIVRLRAFPESGEYGDLLAYFAGLACLRTGKPERAIREFETITGGYPAEKPWYIALSRLKAGQLSEAKADFERIGRSASPFAEEAMEILKEMK